MFTGIITAIGRIETVAPLGDSAKAGMRVTIEVPSLDFNDVAVGDSLAIQGACMTVVEIGTADRITGAANNKPLRRLTVEVSRESLNCTVGLDTPGEVNLEKALRATDRLGGHLVLGHIDGIGTVTSFASLGESHELNVLAPRELGCYIAYKGSITVNGVSLTVNRCNDQANGCEFSINLIPHTVTATTLKHLKPGKRVNLEVDPIARYVERVLIHSKT